ncbi:hypothetical protein FWK35_00011601 [Aphis craccivora]|uniref:Uncharacterized protein n=1 Tax=Aphis craccivora TaxID=307492 RepID=A0A6G0YS75_APHCR|nr:hypothetical protein FWK35_00011601 [Aphis craccivora]
MELNHNEEYVRTDTHKIESNGVGLGQENSSLEENKDISILSTDIQYETGLDLNANELEKVMDGTESNEAYLEKDNSMPETKSSLA